MPAYDYTDSESDLSDSTMDESMNTSRMSKGSLKKHGKKAGFDFEDFDSTIEKCSQEKEQIDQDYHSIRAQNSGHTRRINDLLLQFEEARSRLDKLLRKTTSRRDFDDDFESTSVKASVSSRDVDSRYENDYENSVYVGKSEYESYRENDYSVTVKQDSDSDNEKPKFQSQRSQISVMTTNLAKPKTKGFQMVSLRVKLEDSDA